MQGGGRGACCLPAGTGGRVGRYTGLVVVMCFSPPPPPTRRKGCVLEPRAVSGQSSWQGQQSPRGWVVSPRGLRSPGRCGGETSGCSLRWSPRSCRSGETGRTFPSGSCLERPAHFTFSATVQSLGALKITIQEYSCETKTLNMQNSAEPEEGNKTSFELSNQTRKVSFFSAFL